MITCRLSSCKTGVCNVRLLIILERGCSSMYRKNNSMYKGGKYFVQSTGVRLGPESREK